MTPTTTSSTHWMKYGQNTTRCFERQRRSAIIVAQQCSEQTTVEREDEPIQQPLAPDPQLRIESPTQHQREPPTQHQREPTPVPQTPSNRIRFRDNISRLIFDPDSMPLHTNRTSDPVSTHMAAPVSNLRRSSRASKPVDRFTDDSLARTHNGKCRT